MKIQFSSSREKNISSRDFLEIETLVNDWCDCEVMDNLPTINDGKDEDEEAENLLHGNCCIFNQREKAEAFNLVYCYSRVSDFSSSGKTTIMSRK